MVRGLQYLEWQEMEFKVTCPQPTCGNYLYVRIRRHEALPNMGQCPLCLNVLDTTGLGEVMNFLAGKGPYNV